MTTQKIIFDGDMGGDDLWALAVLGGFIAQGKIDLLGITTCFGNTNVPQASRNVCDMLGVLNRPSIPVYQGADKPISGLAPLLDGAYGENGLSNGKLPKSSLSIESMSASTWIAQTLRSADAPITIMCTGPATNIARVFDENPELDTANVTIIWLGGAIYPSGGEHKLITLPNGDYKRGNITDHAEFNAINDPVAANIITSLRHAQVTIMPLDAGQHMDVDVTRANAFGRMMKGYEAQAFNMMSMLDNAAHLDQQKFKARGGFAFDPQVPVFWDNPDVFLPVQPVRDVQFENNHQAAKGFDAVANGFDFSLLGTHGKMTVTVCEDSNVRVIPGLYSFAKPENVTDTDRDAMHEMTDARWNVLSVHVAKSLHETTGD